MPPHTFFDIVVARSVRVLNEALIQNKELSSVVAPLCAMETDFLSTYHSELLCDSLVKKCRVFLHLYMVGMFSMFPQDYLHPCSTNPELVPWAVKPRNDTTLNKALL